MPPISIREVRGDDSGTNRIVLGVFPLGYVSSAMAGGASETYDYEHVEGIRSQTAKFL